MSDAELMRRLASGELAALGELYERHWRSVYSVLRHRLGSDDAAQDLLSEVFLSLPDSARRYRETGSLRGWLIGIALRKTQEHLRRGRVRSLLARLLGTSSAESVETARAVEARLELEQLFGGLNEAMKSVLTLRVVHGLEVDEIAAALSISENTVWTRIHRARAELKRLRAQHEGEGE